ncbi:hypothetical protein [Halolamina sp.]|jgi:hypothetical protein|uniref:hypothetical protein n=1 Tax=Halolamina sp. TaxID=1940283 RepID=UPI000223B71E|nr:hypothetical protein Halar_2031 [halophilic archaeon DL31]
MRQRTTAREGDEGKPVRSTDGKNVGRVMAVEHGKMHVKPDPGLTDDIRSKLGLGTEDENTYVLTANSIEEITDDEVRLNE